MDDPGAASSSRAAVDEDDDDDDEYEEPGGGNRLLGFMFGNIDCSGDLDADYLDEDAKEHLAALADKLGASLTGIELTKSPSASSNTSEQDYDEKAEDAIDYEDIEEQYEGPEVQAVNEDDHLLPKKHNLAMDVSLASLSQKSSIFDDENYDVDEDVEFVKENEVEKDTSVLPVLTLESGQGPEVVTEKVETSHDEISSNGHSDMEHIPSEGLQVESIIVPGHIDSDAATPLPVLCIEDGMVILRFSEIFGVHEPPKKKENKARPRHFLTKEHVQCSFNIEEDEEMFLKSFQCDPIISRQLILSQNDREPINEDGSEKAGFGLDNKRKGLFSSGQPMKDSPVADVCTQWTGHAIPNFYPLEQQDWEDKIVWGNSPSQSDLSMNSFVPSESDTDSIHGVYETGKCGRVVKISHSEPTADAQNSITAQPLEEINQSGMLTFEPKLRKDSSESAEQKPDTGSEAYGSNFLQRFNKMSLQNRDLLEGSWVDHIIWDDDRSTVKPKLILDLQDEHMLFEISEHKNIKILNATAHCNNLEKPSMGDVHDHSTPIGASLGRFNISNDKYYSSKKSSQPLKAHAKKRSLYGLKIVHSVPALRLQTMKPKLSNKEIMNFHRPKALWYPHKNKEAAKLLGDFRDQGSLKVILKTLPGKIILLRVGALELVSSVIAKASKKLDFGSTEKVIIMHNGKQLEENASLATQNVRPNSILYVLRTKIHLWPRAQKLPGDNKPLRPPGAFKKKSELSVKDGHVVLVEYCEERPLLLGNVGMGAKLCTYYQKSTPSDQTALSLRNGNSGLGPLGNIVALDPAAKSPFLGEISPGCTQSSIETNMYRAPIFPHAVSSTDYLLVRSAKGMLSLRRIDKIFSAGQQEPHMEVMCPGTKSVQTYIWNRLSAFVYREFRAREKPGFLPLIRIDELSSKFPSVAESVLRKRLKHYADLQRGSKGQVYLQMRTNFPVHREDELRKMVTPEDVCAYESMQAGLFRLKNLGIRSLTLPVGLSAAMNRLPDEAIALAAASHIERELQITPWNLSSNFVACLDRENVERLEITGVGDPSGRGLGFSYVRVAPKTGSNTSAKKKAPANRGGTTVTGTDADLRRLSMDAAREVLLKFNVPEENIGKLTRWHRIAMIRKLSSEQATSGIMVDTETLSKFARGQRISFVQLQQQVKEKCQEIWDRQVQSLSAVDGDENDSESEANSDLDSFAGDLENLLDAEEFEEGEEDNISSKGDKMEGVKGLKMRRCPSQTQTEEEIEEEEAEVAEVRWLLDADESAARMKKKMISTVKQQRLGLVATEGKKPTNTIGPTTSMSKIDLSCASKDALEQETYEVDASAIDNLSGKAKAKKASGKQEELLPVVQKKTSRPVKDGVKVVKEKKPFDKPVRENFVCGACGQLGHMRTNKNCPKNREDLETPDSENISGKSHLPDIASGSQLKTPGKNLKHRSMVKAPMSDTTGNVEPSGQKLQARALKVKCGPPDKHPENTNWLQVSVKQSGVAGSGDVAEEPKSSYKINKIIISNKSKPETSQLELPKPTVVIRASGEMDKDQSRKKIIIKKPRNVIDIENIVVEEEVRKTKKIAELSGFEEQKVQWYAEEVSSREETENRWLLEEEEKRRNKYRIAEERTRRMFQEERIMAEEQQKIYEMKIRKDSEERAKARKNKKKMKPVFRDEYMEEYTSSRRDRRIPERERAAKKRSVVDLGRHTAEYGPPTKRRRGGEVLLSNILESIVDKLRDNTTVSYLFLKPVTKKEAPDYFEYIDQPMDLSTIKEKVRRMEYKNREDFRHDVCQITINAHIYNAGRNPGIPPLADQLLELCDYLLDTNDESLTEAESGIK